MSFPAAAPGVDLPSEPNPAFQSQAPASVPTNVNAKPPSAGAAPAAQPITAPANTTATHSVPPRTSAPPKRYNPINPALYRSLSDAPIMLLLLAGAFALRFYQIYHPDEVVFDEVHFGKFAAYYLRREYFFDVHPPLAKLINAFVAWLAGFDGKFEFTDIGDKYKEHNVPYVRMRCGPAFLGSLLVPLAYAIMRESGYGQIIGIFTACLVLFENGHIVQDRLILLDAALVLFMTTSLLAYIKFHKERYNAFSTRWWFWMFVTGANLALTMSCKMVGLLTIFSVGTAVVWDLWNLLDHRRGKSMGDFARHFAARSVGLILWPAAVYIFWFWVHFAILTKSGTGDVFMSPEFQETLQGNPLLADARDIHYGDRVVLKHKNTEAFLHSHLDKYPLRYDDGRVSSQGQQVTAYPYNDTNNLWEIVPVKQLPESYSGEEAVVRNKDVVRLLHVNTESVLLSHDVAAPLIPTNEEFTTWPWNDTSRFNDTLFELHIDGAGKDTEVAWQSKASNIHLVHVPTRVSLWTHDDEVLPDWGFKHQEVNGNKNVFDKSALWVVDELHPDELADDYEERIKPLPPKEVKSMSFWKKWVELQLTMLHQNNLLTSSHPYASGPLNWPFLISGISFWTQNERQEQIYMIGNPVAWFIGTLSLSMFVGIMLADALARQRGVYPIPSAIRNRLLTSGGFIFVAWMWHYLPFYLMNRQLFLHHYLPANFLACLMAGTVVNFVLTESVNFPISRPGPGLRDGVMTYTRRARFNIVDSTSASVLVGMVALVIGGFYFVAPLTYGWPMSSDEVKSHQLLTTWTLHFIKPN